MDDSHSTSIHDSHAKIFLRGAHLADFVGRVLLFDLGPLGIYTSISLNFVLFIAMSIHSFRSRNGPRRAICTGTCGSCASIVAYKSLWLVFPVDELVINIVHDSFHVLSDPLMELIELSAISEFSFLEHFFRVQRVNWAIGVRLGIESVWSVQEFGKHQ